jgi:glyoxylase-like metal-dependent hydrolase (beta-lactamase superfamily II)
VEHLVALHGGDWTEPGAHQVAPDVWRIPLVLPHDGLKAVNVYALRQDDGLTLVDGGWALDEARVGLVKALADIGAELPDIRRFLVTHAHRDHYTQAIAIRREFGTDVLLGTGERPTIETILGGETGPLSGQLTMLSRAGADPVMVALEKLGVGQGPVTDHGYASPSDWIDEGDRFAVGDRMLEAVATPGHTRGHLVFVDRAAGLLFAGDHVLPHITPSIAFEPSPPSLALDDYLRSLALVRAWPDLTLLPAHGPAGGSAHARIDGLLAHHDDRLAAIRAQVTAGGIAAYEVACQIGWTSRGRALLDLDPFNQMLAVCETVLHLDLLVARGSIAVRSDGDLSLYSRSSATDRAKT